MVVKKAEKPSKEFSDHERPHLTKYDHIKNNEKGKVRLLLGELPIPSLVLCFTVHTRILVQASGLKTGPGDSIAFK
jgi:superfamily II helicase